MRESLHSAFILFAVTQGSETVPRYAYTAVSTEGISAAVDAHVYTEKVTVDAAAVGEWKRCGHCKIITSTTRSNLERGLTCADCSPSLLLLPSCVDVRGA